MDSDLLGGQVLDHESCRKLIKQLAQEDGKLISPIDLSLEITKPLDLDPLKWIHLDNAPSKMKLTNTGNTVIVSAKWANHRPYLTGGPLDGNYVFSQIHFHWGADEHEGSEHTVRGICYPLEMHVAFFKSRYLTSEAALKHDDGLIIIVYLFKLQNTSMLGLQTLSSQLSKVIQPQTSTMLQSSPLSALLVPFYKDYLMYWGAIATQNCSHTIMWLVSRSAMAVSTEVLETFRTLLNSKKEPMIKNFRETNPSMDRSVFHVCPSENTVHVLLPGSVEPPGQEIIVGFVKVPSLDQSLAVNVFSRGDGEKSEQKKMTKALKNNTPKKEQNETVDTCNISKNNKIISKSNEKTPVEVKQNSSVEVSNKKVCTTVQRMKLKNKDNVTTRKLLEKQRKDSLIKPPTPYSGVSAATMKRISRREENMRAENENVQQVRKMNESDEKAVCVHPDVRDSEAPEPMRTPSEHSSSHPKLSASQGISRKPSLGITATPPSAPVTAARQPNKGKVLRTVSRGNNSRNRRSGCL